MEKGQLHIDFLLAFALFIIVYAAVFQAFFFFTVGTRETPDELTMESELLSSIFVESAGVPKNWTSYSQIQYLGFAYYNITTFSNIIDKRKIDVITSQSCSDLKVKTDFTFNFKVSFVNNYTTGNTSSCSASEPSDARKVERTVYIWDGMNFTSAKMELYTWL